MTICASLPWARWLDLDPACRTASAAWPSRHLDKPHVVIQRSMGFVEVPHHNESTSAFDIRRTGKTHACL